MTANQRFSKALDWLLDQRKVRSKTHFADELGWNRNKANNLERSETAQLMGQDLIQLIQVFPAINWTWVVSGDGQMLGNESDEIDHSTKSTDTPIIYGVSQDQMNDREMEIVRIITGTSDLPIEEREKRLIEAWVFQNNKITKYAELFAGM